MQTQAHEGILSNLPPPIMDYRHPISPVLQPSLFKRQLHRTPTSGDFLGKFRADLKVTGYPTPGQGGPQGMGKAMGWEFFLFFQVHFLSSSFSEVKSLQDLSLFPRLLPDQRLVWCSNAVENQKLRIARFRCSGGFGKGLSRPEISFFPLMSSCFCQEKMLNF